MVLKTCKDEICTQPWRILHPHEEVSNLAQALHERFDSFYEKQPQMWFSECPLAYIAEVENQNPVVAHKEWSALNVQGKKNAKIDWSRHWQHFT